MRNFRNRISYANVTATLALVIALGGTGYAAMTLPRNSVGSAQLKKGAVQKSDIKKGAVTDKTVKNRSLGTGDLSTKARQALGGYTAAVSSAGGLARGNAVAAANVGGDGVYTVQWRRDVSTCEAVASLASVPGGPVADPPGGSATLRFVSPGVEVRTFDAAGAPADLPFTVIAIC